MNKLNVLIVDDDSDARDLLRMYCEEIPDITIIGECSNGVKAIEMIRELKPNLVFLDIEMPEVDGFDVLRELQEDAPAVVFVTAHDKYALEAFSVSAIDYLLKPFAHDRFLIALERVKKRIDHPWQDNEIKEIIALASKLKDSRNFLQRIAVRIADRVLLVKVNDINWIESERNYLRLHAGNDSFLLRETMSEMERKLNPNQFIRIHKSFMVNLDFIKEIRRWFPQSYQVILNNDIKLPLSRNYRNKLSNFIDNR